MQRIKERSDFVVSEWFLEDCTFSEQLGIRVQEWNRTRMPGFDGIEHFNNMVSAFAQRYMRMDHVRAKTPEHKFQVTCTLLSDMQVGQGRMRTNKLNKVLRFHRCRVNRMDSNLQYFQNLLLR